MDMNPENPEKAYSNEPTKYGLWDEQHAEKKKIINTLTSFGILAICFYAINNFAQGNYVFIAIDFILILIASGVLVINFFGSYRIARVYFLITNTL